MSVPPAWPLPSRGTNGSAAAQPVEPGDWLARLRSTHPDWAFVYDPFAPRWVAVRGRHEVLDARTAFELADALACSGRSHARGVRP